MTEHELQVVNIIQNSNAPERATAIAIDLLLRMIAGENLDSIEK